MKKMLFIMNPFAGVKRANRHLADILLTFTQAGYEVITHMTLGRTPPPSPGRRAKMLIWWSAAAATAR